MRCAKLPVILARIAKSKQSHVECSPHVVCHHSHQYFPSKFVFLIFLQTSPVTMEVQKGRQTGVCSQNEHDRILMVQHRNVVVTVEVAVVLQCQPLAVALILVELELGGKIAPASATMAVSSNIFSVARCFVATHQKLKSIFTSTF